MHVSAFTINICVRTFALSQKGQHHIHLATKEETCFRASNAWERQSDVRVRLVWRSRNIRECTFRCWSRLIRVRTDGMRLNTFIFFSFGFYGKRCILVSPFWVCVPFTVPLMSLAATTQSRWVTDVLFFLTPVQLWSSNDFALFFRVLKSRRPSSPDTVCYGWPVKMMKEATRENKKKKNDFKLESETQPVTQIEQCYGWCTDNAKLSVGEWFAYRQNTCYMLMQWRCVAYSSNGRCRQSEWDAIMNNENYHLAGGFAFVWIFLGPKFVHFMCVCVRVCCFSRISFVVFFVRSQIIIATAARISFVYISVYLLRLLLLCDWRRRHFFYLFSVHSPKMRNRGFWHLFLCLVTHKCARRVISILIRTIRVLHRVSPVLIVRWRAP